MAADFDRGLAEVVRPHQHGAVLPAQGPQGVGDDPGVDGRSQGVGGALLGNRVRAQFPFETVAAAIVDDEVAGHGVQPRPHRVGGTRGQDVGLLPQPQQRFLHHVLGELAVAAGEAQDIALQCGTMLVVNTAQQVGGTIARPGRTGVCHDGRFPRLVGVRPVRRVLVMSRFWRTGPGCGAGHGYLGGPVR